MAMVEFRPHSTVRGRPKMESPAWLIARGNKIDLIFNAADARDLGIEAGGRVIAGYDGTVKAWSLLPVDEGPSYLVHQYGRHASRLYVRITVSAEFLEKFSIKDRSAFARVAVKGGRFIMYGGK